MKTKVTVWLKSGKRLVYHPETENPQIDWALWLRNEDGNIRCGRFVVPKVNIDYVEFE